MGGGDGEPAVERLELRPDTLAAIAARGVPTPTYDRDHLSRHILHIGVGGFHRSHLAVYTHELAELGGDWGIAGLGVLPHDVAMADALAAQSGLYTLIVRDDEQASAAVIGSLLGHVATAGRADVAVSNIADPAVRVVSLTITEAGYADDRDGTVFDSIAAGLAQRRRDRTGSVTVLSCDNVPGNGDAARSATLAAASRHGADLAAWVSEACSFPNSMVDRITPTTTDSDRQWLAERWGVVDRWPVVAEPFRQWVVEDHFAAGRPDWEDVGVVFTDDVRLWELYKLRLLNAAHSCMAYLCALAGITYVDEAVAMPSVSGYLAGLLDEEAVPSLQRIAGHPPEDYVTTVLHRFSNRGIRDQIARLCVDGASKFPTFLIPTVEYQLGCGGPVRRAALALAGWARYLATVPEAEQAADAAAMPARAAAQSALTDPARFLDADVVISAPLRSSDRFRAAFVDGYRAIERDGPLAAMDAVGLPDPAGGDPV